MSHYELTCVCGARIHSTDPVGVCECERQYRIVWGEQDPTRLASMAAAVLPIHRVLLRKREVQQ